MPNTDRRHKEEVFSDEQCAKVQTANGCSMTSEYETGRGPFRPAGTVPEFSDILPRSQNDELGAEDTLDLRKNSNKTTDDTEADAGQRELLRLGGNGF